ncbi:hypothetical protein NP233_g11019 [Leucocoprinus birnbaumii]|uniref:FMN hydroxy acid dehydrogenase domain-containing protein n=1 Tax=Leucocoprinus birnbaumii TaxID=56174 RepID=A0AAD5VHF0_9AGAR|nr:hypothetical protein NP233_g11019 [Leucocoprinus birnbaumii]
MTSFYASLSHKEIMDAATSSQTLFFQLYKHFDDSIAEQRVREAEALGYKVIVLTVDSVVIGNRERDTRNTWELEDEERGGPIYWSESDIPRKEPESAGIAASLTVNRDMNKTWDKTIPWLKRITKLPIVLKGEKGLLYIRTTYERLDIRKESNALRTQFLRLMRESRVYFFRTTEVDNWSTPYRRWRFSTNFV